MKASPGPEKTCEKQVRRENTLLENVSIAKPMCHETKRLGGERGHASFTSHPDLKLKSVKCFYSNMHVQSHTQILMTPKYKLLVSGQGFSE